MLATSEKRGAYRPGYERVAERIAELITGEGLQPGDRMPTEQALCEQLGVSRTVVREAIKLLTAAGHVRARRGSGIYVDKGPNSLVSAAINLSVAVQPDDIRNLFIFRCTQEMQTARLAAEHITVRQLRNLEEIVARHRRFAESGEQTEINPDLQFHLSVADAADNRFLAAAVETAYRLQNWALRLVHTNLPPGVYVVAADQHAAILTAISDGQADLAARAMEAHIHTTMSQYQEAVRRRLVEPTP